ncbi:MAG: ABC transporter permease [Candidatus Firestonebacteria bacterium]
MKFSIIKKMGYKALIKNKMRSFLTMLGVMIGVASVVTMISIATGAKISVKNSIASMGTNVMFVMLKNVIREGVQAGTVQTLTTYDADALKKECAQITSASPIFRANAQAIYKNQNWTTSAVGCNEDYFKIRNWSLEKGEYFTQQEIRGNMKLCILGKTVADNLFGNQDPINEIIRMKKVPFKVIGVLTAKGQSSFGQDQDDMIFMPYTTAQKKIFRMVGIPAAIHAIMMSSTSQEEMEIAIKQAKDLLRQRHNLKEKDDDDFTIRTQTDILSTAESTSKVMTILLGSIASVSLLVGGIGIMNIMLVSVAERTREIGIRIAIGAKEKEILLQFLFEAIALSTFGGIIGIILGIIFSNLIPLLAGWDTLISFKSIIISFVFSIAIGIFFGLQPAWKASKLNPIEALRYE